MLDWQPSPGAVLDLDRVPRETSSTPASSTTTSSTSATATSAAESNSATQDALVDVGGVEAAEPDSSTLSARQAGVLANFGIGPENLDDEAQARMAHAIGRLDGMLACTGGDEAACSALGPGPINLSDGTSADGTEQEILLEEADYTLSLKVSTDPLTGETTSRLLYIDADGTYISGLSNQPVKSLFAPEPTPEAEGPAEVAPDVSPDEETWLNTLAGIDADYHVLARLGGALQAYGAASDLAVAVPLLLAPEPTMLTKVAAAGAGLRGLDDLQAGVRTLISGEPTETVTQTIATDVAIALGADPEAAKTVGLGADMVTGLLNPAGRLRHMTTEASERLAKEAAEQAGRHTDDAARGLRGAEEGLEDGSAASRATARVLEADPVRTILGPARQSHPQLYDDLLREADELGAELIERPGMMAYSPSPRGGKPGQLFLDPDASISAVIHEMQHLRDDLAQGWPGMGKLLDKDTRWAMEEAAYRAEREFVEGLDTPGKQAVLEQLLRNQEAERLAIYEDLP